MGRNVADVGVTSYGLLELRLLDDAPAASRGPRGAIVAEAICFFYLEATHGVLVEYVEPSEAEQ